MSDRIHAIEFIPSLTWLNVKQPLTMKQLRGKIVLLHFWAYGCMHSTHALSDISRLEKKYPQSLIVIGVHSAKFQAEKKTENIRKAILRYGIKHPVVNDPEFFLWRQYDIHTWLTFVIIDPEGCVSETISGEVSFEQLDQMIGTLTQAYQTKGLIDKRPQPLKLESDVGVRLTSSSPLQFPGKILVANDHLYIADSNHNRILVTSLEGNIQQVIGQGSMGSQDGSFEEARFYHPQGMALSRNPSLLSVCDTGNHLIRHCNLETKQVQTIVSTAQQASFPQDILIQNETAYIAGLRQIWAVDLKTMESKLFVTAAQPSGLTTDGENLIIADSEISAIQMANFKTGTVQTLVGLDPFEFGDIDGVGDMVRLQHPLSVAWGGNGKIYVADTYNNKIKILDLKTRQCETFLETEIHEPGGISICDEKLYIADTNNHAIRVVDLNTKQTTTLSISTIS